MKKLLSLAAATALCLTAVAAHADGPSRGAVTDQRYQAGQHSAARATVLNSCPREFREMYRGDLYCRSPERQVIAPRHRACPDGVSGLYRGNITCVSGRG
ncbi:MAG: hypothetical protein V2I76_03915 [Roseobacter sp.]|jgi:hypothetical protein|nr:hypothetical protein [Roseobacter sp.]